MSMPKVDITSDEQNAFVQDWLVAWAKKHTVYGTKDWRQSAIILHEFELQQFKKGDRHFVPQSVRELMADARLFEEMIEVIQETYGGGGE